MPSFNYKEEIASGNGGGSRKEVPIDYEGTLRVTIGAITEKLANQGGIKYGVPFIIEAGEYENARIWENIFWDTDNEKLNNVSKGKLARICQAAGAPDEMFDWTLELEGRDLAIKVKRSKNNPDFRDVFPMALKGNAKPEPASKPAPPTAELPKTEEVVSDKIPF